VRVSECTHCAEEHARKEVMEVSRGIWTLGGELVTSLVGLGELRIWVYFVVEVAHVSFGVVEGIGIF
jgi:hypothetical protein